MGHVGLKKAFWLFLWASSTLTIMFVFAQQKLSDFDPKGSLLYASMTDNFDADVTKVFQSLSETTQGSVFHLTNDKCACSRLAKKHIQDIDKRLTAKNFSIQSLDISDLPQLSLIIPSTPAVVMFTEQGTLGYVGPYSSGFFCNEKTSLVGSIIQTLSQGAPHGAIVISDSKGCYCNHA